MGEHSYETIIKFDQWFRSCRLKKKKIPITHKYRSQYLTLCSDDELMYYYLSVSKVRKGVCLLIISAAHSPYYVTHIMVYL